MPVAPCVIIIVVTSGVGGSPVLLPASSAFAKLVLDLVVRPDRTAHHERGGVVDHRTLNQLEDQRIRRACPRLTVLTEKEQRGLSFHVHVVAIQDIDPPPCVERPSHLPWCSGWLSWHHVVGFAFANLIAVSRLFDGKLIQIMAHTGGSDLEGSI